MTLLWCLPENMLHFIHGVSLPLCAHVGLTASLRYGWAGAERVARERGESERASVVSPAERFVERAHWLCVDAFKKYWYHSEINFTSSPTLQTFFSLTKSQRTGQAECTEQRSISLTINLQTRRLLFVLKVIEGKVSEIQIWTCIYFIWIWQA